MNYSDFVAALFNKMVNPTEELLHAAIGLAGEAGELVEAVHKELDCEEEIGDIRFYIQAVWNIFGWKEEHFQIDEDYNEPENYNPFEQYVVDACNVLDVAKKSWAYKKELDKEKLALLINKLWNTYLWVLEECGLTDDVVIESNVKKLSVRFPGGVYSNQAAIDRADKNE